MAFGGNENNQTAAGNATAGSLTKRTPIALAGQSEKIRTTVNSIKLCVVSINSAVVQQPLFCEPWVCVCAVCLCRL